MTPKWPKMAKKVTGVPKKIQKKSKRIEKMAKNVPTEPRVTFAIPGLKGGGVGVVV